jgi:thiol-disulfide isomerase/thioredoxin
MLAGVIYMKEVVVITASWCSSCLIMDKRIKELVSQDEQIKIDKIDVDIDLERAKQYELKDGDTLPIIIYKDKRLCGEHSLDELKELVK